MKLLEICHWKIEILLITAKTGFCSLIFHMLASYIDPKVSKDFCDIFTWQITKKLIVINSFFKDASVILLNMVSSKVPFQNFQPQILLTNFSTYLTDFFRVLQAICKPADLQIKNHLKMFLRIAAVNAPSQ